MLAQLSEHYREPVRPVSEYCNAFDAWAMVLEENHGNHEKEGHRAFSFVDHIDDIRLAIRKSCLLDRLIYGGEKLRTRMCPDHRGRWSGIDAGPQYGKHPHGHCERGCYLTGWLPEPEDVERWNAGNFERISARCSDVASLVKELEQFEDSYPLDLRPQWREYVQKRLGKVAA